MKNIFTLKTDQKSNLYYNTNDKCFQVSEVLKDSTPLKENQFVYVIDSEELTTSSDIKDKWFLSEYGFVIKADRVEGVYLHHVGGGSNYTHFYKKVLLTNDPQLIADGVQEIEKSVLISFAENPVDYVEVIKELNETDYNICVDYTYLYSLDFPPKENQIMTDLKNYFKNTPREKILSDWEETKQFDKVGITVDEYLQNTKKFIENTSPEKLEELMKEFDNFEVETLEEASEKYYKNNKFKSDYPHCPISFKDGAKWQSERSYSEEETGELIYNIFGEYGKHYDIMIDGAKLHDLFEQFKKK